MKKVKQRKRRPRIFKVYLGEQIFNAWLDENIDRFHYKPILQEKGNGYVIYGFEGIINNIILHISFNSVEASLFFDNLLECYVDKDKTFFDMQYIEYIGYEKCHPLKGYYDADRIDKNYEYFSTQKELYINNVFETIIKTTNQLFVPENSLYLIDSDGMTMGYISRIDKDNYKVQSNMHEDNAVITKEGYKVYKYALFGEK